LTRELQQVAWALGGDQGPETVGELRNKLEYQALSDPDPEELWALGEQLDYGVTVNWSAEGNGGSCDVLFSKGNQIQALSSDTSPPRRDSVLRLSAFPPAQQPAEHSLLWQKVHKLQQYTNNPLQAKITSTLVPQLRSFLRTQ